jgi:hypothetical protein
VNRQNIFEHHPKMLHFSAALQEAFLGYKKTTYIGAGNKGPIEIKSA